MKLSCKLNARRSLRGRSFFSSFDGRSVTYWPQYFPNGHADDGFRVVQNEAARMENDKALK